MRDVLNVCFFQGGQVSIRGFDAKVHNKGKLKIGLQVPCVTRCQMEKAEKAFGNCDCIRRCNLELKQIDPNTIYLPFHNKTVLYNAKEANF